MYFNEVRVKLSWKGGREGGMKRGWREREKEERGRKRGWREKEEEEEGELHLLPGSTDSLARSLTHSLSAIP